MEALLEALFELFLELFFEIICTALAEVIGDFFNTPMSKKTRNRIRIVISSIVFIATGVLCILALIYKTGMYVYASVAYMLFILLINVIRFIDFQVTKETNRYNLYSLLKRIINMIFPIVIFTLALIYQNRATVALCIISSIVELVFVIICIFHGCQEKHMDYERFMDTVSHLFLKIKVKNTMKQRNKLVHLLNRYPEYTYYYLESAKKDEIFFILDNCFKHKKLDSEDYFRLQRIIEKYPDISLEEYSIEIIK